MADNTVKVSFIGDSSSLKKAVDDSDGHLARLSSSVAGMAKAAALGFAAAGVGLGVFAKSAISAAQESAKVTAQTEAVIKSTGAAANVTAQQVASLATAISNKTGVDDEAIQSGQNLLLTFTELQNRAGKGNDIFNQATKVMVDMSAAMGTDASSTAIQLGKALNDPIKGISALTRVGVTFTDAQKKQIETMQKAGDIAGAQKVILAELTKEFGGSAAAQATAADRMKVAFGNLQEQIGGMLIPVVEKLSTFMVERVIPALSSLAERVMPVLINASRGLIGGIQALISAFRDPGAPWEEGSPFVLGMARIGQIVRQVFDWLRENVPPVLEEIGRIAVDVFEQRLVPAFQAVADVVMDDLWPAIQATFNFLNEHREILVGIAVAIGVGLVAAFLSWAAAAAAAAAATIAATAPVIAIGVAIAALVAGVIYAYQHWGWFKDAVDAVASFITGTLVPAFQKMVGFISDEVIPIIAKIIGWYIEWVKFQVAVYTAVAEAVIGIIKWFQDLGIVIYGFAQNFGRFVAGFGSQMAEWLTVVWQWGEQVVTWFRELPNRIGEFFSGLADIIKRPFQEAFEAIKWLWNNTVGGFGFTAPDWIPGVGGKGFHIPYMAEGGIVKAQAGGMLALLGEGGQDEAVIPLNQLKSMTGGGGGQTINVYIGKVNAESPGAINTLTASIGRELAVALRGSVN